MVVPCYAFVGKVLYRKGYGSYPLRTLRFFAFLRLENLPQGAQSLVKAPIIGYTMAFSP